MELGEYNVDKGHGKEVKKELNTGKMGFLEKQREDGSEFTEIVLKVPKERKSEIESLVNGFCLGVKACETKDQNKQDPVAV